jgi:oligopeptide/dipeptide ABC transporter ATP-binding protein
MAALLEVRSLSVTLGPALLVRDVSLCVAAGTVHALIGESGCGKTSAARAMIGLQPEGAVVGGSTLVDGRPPRPGPLTLIPQDAQGALNPVLSVGDQLGEALLVHQGLRGQAHREAAGALLEAVGLGGEGAALLRAFPHQLSGGMRQRVLVAAALAARPLVLIADEPTTALDAALRVQVLELFRALAVGRGLAVLLITHELEAVERACDELSVMYAGRVVEQGATAAVLAAPRHPYTRALLAARPSAGLHPIDGLAPTPTDRPRGCAFRPRCARALSACVAPPELALGVACFNPEPAP